MARDKITHLLSLIPKGKVYARAVHFAKNRPGKQFGPIRLGKELGIPVEHAKIVGSRLARDGHVTHGKFKGQPTFVPKAGGKSDNQNSTGLQSDLGGREESQQAESVLRSGKEAAGGSGVLESEEPKHEFASTQVNLPDNLASAVREAGKSIPDGELAADGREDEPHVTVKYGLHADDPEELRQLLADESPIRATLGKSSIFPAKQADIQRGGADVADVVKMDVDSPDLHRLNKKIADAMPHTDTHPTYQPHVTLAYVKPGTGKKYDGHDVPGATGQQMQVASIIFSDKNGEHHDIPLGPDNRLGSPSPVDVKEPELPALDKVNFKDLLEHPLAARSMKELALAGIKGGPEEIGVRLLLPGRYRELGLSPDEAEQLGAHYLSLV